MNHKKTFWMNVSFAILWVFCCLIFFASDIDYVEYTLTHKTLSLITRLFIFTTLIVTAVHLRNSNTPLVAKLAIFGNYISISMIISYLIFSLYFRHFSFILSIDFLILLFVYSLCIFPFVINLREIRKPYS